MSASAPVQNPSLRARVERLARDRGVPTAARELGLSRTAVLGVIAGLPVRSGTLAQIRERLTLARAEKGGAR